jgi:hypothetical protein
LPLVDELALEFDALADLLPTLAAEGCLTPKQVSSIITINEALDAMTAQHDVGLWDASALASRKEWAEVRREALAALTELGGAPST